MLQRPDSSQPPQIRQCTAMISLASASEGAIDHTTDGVTTLSGIGTESSISRMRPTSLRRHQSGPFLSRRAAKAASRISKVGDAAVDRRFSFPSIKGLPAPTPTPKPILPNVGRNTVKYAYPLFCTRNFERECLVPEVNPTNQGCCEVAVANIINKTAERVYTPRAMPEAGSLLPMGCGRPHLFAPLDVIEPSFHVPPVAETEGPEDRVEDDAQEAHARRAC